ncbi:hypothetical protein OH77DRAFT_1517397 [Trametes cingulata]|nr:hypothetical protein OH77DRAFT_1517397 [Trametes cingulata]
MAKPRNSVLFLFDPLQQEPSTPCRDSSSPELGASDKENELPPGDVTVFFSRTYGVHKQQGDEVQRPRTPNFKGKLIDIGDTPVQDRLWDDAGHDGSDADEEQSEGEAENASVLSPASRTPLADLDVEETPRPQREDSRRPLKALSFATSSVTTSPPHKESPLRALLAAPQGSPLAEVINSINFSALNVSENNTPTIEHAPALHEENVEGGRPPSPFPEITVCAPETPVMPDFEPKQHEEPAVASAMNGSTLRPPSTLTQLSPDDPRRTSVDLYSSFHLQMQSAEMSFDLLNDKISFLGNAQDSFWAAGEDPMFEFDEENRAPAAKLRPKPKSQEEKLSPVEEAPLEPVERVFSPPARIAQMIDIPVVSSPTETAVRIPLPMSPPPSTPSPRTTPPASRQQAQPPAPPSPPTSPVSLDEPSLLLEPEPLPPPMPMPPPVPGLRIVKKTFKVTGRRSIVPAPAAESSGSKPSSQRMEKQETAAKKPSPVTTKAAAAPAAPIVAPQPQAPRPNFAGIQRPPASMLAAGVVIGLPPQGSSHSTSASTSSSSSNASSASRGARAHDTSASAAAARYAAAGVQRPNFAAKASSLSRGTATAPVRPAKAPTSTSGVSRAASASATISRTSASAASSSGLRPPSRIAAPGATASAGSTLPRPASRLPGPSGAGAGLTRHASIGSSSGLMRPRAATTTRPPTGGRF